MMSKTPAEKRVILRIRDMVRMAEKAGDHPPEKVLTIIMRLWVLLTQGRDLLAQLRRLLLCPRRRCSARHCHCGTMPPPLSPSPPAGDAEGDFILKRMGPTSVPVVSGHG